MKLYLIRHASADNRGLQYPDDSKRPLIAKGFLQADTLSKFLETIGISFDYLCSSPYTRAVQTATPLQNISKNELCFSDKLTSSNYPALIEELKSYKKGSSIALVGHEPYMSGLASYLLNGKEFQVNIKFKKAAIMTLEGNLEKYFSLLNFISYKEYKPLCSTSQNKIVN